MPEECRFKPPLISRWLIRLASWIVPERARADWRVRWDSGLQDLWTLVERGELSANTAKEVNRHCWRAFTDAFWIRFSREHLRNWVRGPAFPLAVCATTFVVLAVASHGFAAARAISRPAPIQDPDSLVTIRFTGSVSDPTGVPPRLIPVWRQKSTLLADIAGYRHPMRSPNAWVTPNFFRLMGVQPVLGRLFQPGDENVVLLSGRSWRMTFGSDPRVVGSTIPVRGKPFTVIGVLPEQFWAVSGNIAVWAPLVLEPQPQEDLPFLIGAVGRVKDGVSENALRVELAKIARTVGYKLPTPPQVLAFTSMPSRVIYGYLFGTGFALVIGLALIVFARPAFSGRGWKYWGFFVAKTFSAMTILPLLWIEGNAALAALLPRSEISEVFSAVVVTLLFIISIGCAVFWSFIDQRRRCPVCLELLTMPTTIGSWGSTLDPVSTEFLCEQGHGSLSHPETVSAESERWTSMDDSWRDLFQNKK